jgi:catechol 2,3-dioxygenase-like lactoylglutathione lyase family enzyme
VKRLLQWAATFVAPAAAARVFLRRVQNAARPSSRIKVQLNQLTLPATDVAQSVDFYVGLGLRLIVDSAPRYARLECVSALDAERGTTLSLHQVAQRPAVSAVVVYFECADLDDRVLALQAAGYVFTQAPRDEPWLWREARLLDPSDNVLCLYWAGTNRRSPPWRVA